mmetsp:Transcript_61165/g.157747  ORF Transcript_61165/g.157747 Transcript_61165/m.157747 type:complete len:235 (-) Transcript_61165:134-838(-)
MTSLTSSDKAEPLLQGEAGPSKDGSPTAAARGSVLGFRVTVMKRKSCARKASSNSSASTRARGGHRRWRQPCVPWRGCLSTQHHGGLRVLVHRARVGAVREEDGGDEPRLRRLPTAHHPRSDGEVTRVPCEREHRRCHHSSHGAGTAHSLARRRGSWPRAGGGRAPLAGGRPGEGAPRRQDPGGRPGRIRWASARRTWWLACCRPARRRRRARRLPRSRDPAHRGSLPLDLRVV